MNLEELRLRRRALTRYFNGGKPAEICKRLGRSLSWFKKWRARYSVAGYAGLSDQSRRPKHPARRYSVAVERLIVQTHRRLKRRRVGCAGAKYVQRELKRIQLKPLPGCSKIQRVLRAHHLTHPHGQRRTRSASYPHPHAKSNFVLQALDWISRRLRGGTEVYAFQTVDHRSRDLSSDVARDKSWPTVRTIVLAAWKWLGLPHAILVDNDAVFCGGYRGRRVMGQFVRLCLYLGIEPIFTPFYDPESNGVAEGVNSLWAMSFWNKRRFRSYPDVRRHQPEFVRWYRQEYRPPALHGHSVRLARKNRRSRPLTQAQIDTLPNPLPITAGRIHFIRLVDADGQVVILNETWNVGWRLAGEYVWATVFLKEQVLCIYYRPSAQKPFRLIKSWQYKLNEPVLPPKPEFAHKRPNLDTMC